MSRNTKPRRKYRPRPVVTNPLRLAINRAHKIPAAAIEDVMSLVEASFKAMREGVGNEDHWAALAGTVEIALSIERLGVVRGLQGHLKAAEAALATIKARATGSGTWKPTPLYFDEIGALDEFTWLHRVQLRELSVGEWRRAHTRAEAIVRSERGRVVDINELQVEGVAA